MGTLTRPSDAHSRSHRDGTAIEAASIPIGIWMQARRLGEGVDLKDTPFVALTLHLEAHLWTDDEELKTSLRAKGFDRFFEQ